MIRDNGRARISSENAKDFLSIFQHQAWRNRAACRTMDSERFSLPDNYVQEDKAALIEAVEVCESCPVIKECGDSASKEDKKFAIYGGKLPSELKERGPGRPRRTMLDDGICKAKLHTLKSEDDLARDGRCAECNRIAAKEYYYRKRKLKTPSCRNGHEYRDGSFDIRPDKSRRCLECYNANRQRNNSATRKARGSAKMSA